MTGAPPFRLVPLAFADLAGWAEDDHAAAFAAFRQGAAVIADHPPKRRALGTDAAALVMCLVRAAALPGAVGRDKARAFFESAFRPFAIEPADGTAFFTGYYEPVVLGSRTPSPAFPAPLYRVPPDLVEIDPDRPPAGIDPGTRFARRMPDGRLVPHPDRGAIMAGALAGQGLELVHLADPVDAFFVHVQGAARVRLAEGGEMRVTYAAKSGHPYTPIGRVLIEMGALPRGGATMAAIRAWLAAHPAEAPAVMAANRSTIFFREAPVEDAAAGPVAAAKVPLRARRSLAIDRLIHSFHTPVFVATTLPGGGVWNRLMIAHDTGSAIVGPARGDIFFGSGDEAGALAGAMQAKGRFVVLLPEGQGG